MAPTFTYPELNSDQSQVTDDGLRNLGNAAADLVCDLWQNYTEWTSSFSDPTGIGKINNALLSRLCKPRGKSPQAPPSLQFTGGQCAKYYNVRVQLEYGPIPYQLDTYIYNVLGPIKGLSTGGNPPSGQIKIGVQAAPEINHTDGFYPVLQGTPTNLLPYKLIAFTVTPVSGADNCGNPEPSYPVKTPPQNAVQKTVNVNVGAGVVVPVAAVFAPVIFKPNVNVDAQLHVDLGGIGVTFDAGGVTIAPNFTFSGGDKQLPPAATNPANPQINFNAKQECTPTDLTSVYAKLDELKVKSDAIKTELDDVKDCACPITSTPTTVSLGNGISGYAALPSNCIKVALSLTTIPANAKTQKSTPPEPPLYFAGYFYWGDGTGRSERIAINSAQGVYFPPLWATAFGWNLYTGYNCSVVATFLSPSKPGGQLAGLQVKNAAH